MGFDLEDLVARQKIRLDYVRVERSEIEETGEYDLEGFLFPKPIEAVVLTRTE